MGPAGGSWLAGNAGQTFFDVVEVGGGVFGGATSFVFIGYIGQGGSFVAGLGVVRGDFRVLGTGGAFAAGDATVGSRILFSVTTVGVWGSGVAFNTEIAEQTPTANGSYANGSASIAEKHTVGITGIGLWSAGSAMNTERHEVSVPAVGCWSSGRAVIAIGSIPVGGAGANHRVVDGPNVLAVATIPVEVLAVAGRLQPEVHPVLVVRPALRPHQIGTVVFGDIAALGDQNAFSFPFVHGSAPISLAPKQKTD